MILKEIKTFTKHLLGSNNTEKLYRLYIFYNRIIRSKTSDRKSCNEFKKYSVENRQTFFGYYDITPFSQNNRYILSMVGPRGNKPPNPGDELTIGYFNIDNEKNFNPIATTTTWCWQQGCRLQWYPANDELIIFNKMLDNNKFGSVILNFKTQEVVKIFDTPIYDISKNGDFALTLNFSRLHRLRPGYGYVGMEDNTFGKLAPDNDGVWLVDLNTGNRELLLNIRDIVNLSPLESMDGAEHYINHIKFNPNSNRFMFFHLWVKNKKRYGRLMTSDLKAKNVCILANEGHVSHYAWKSDTELLVYSTHSKTGTGYHLYKDLTNEISVVGKGTLTGDGHPSYSPEERIILTDTLPDKYGERNLLLYNYTNYKLSKIGSFYSPLKFSGEVRCDLHPRWDRIGDYICLDSAHEGGRAMYLINLSKLNIK